MTATADDPAQTGPRAHDLQETATRMVAILPRIFKTVMRQARESESLRSDVTSDMGDAQIWTLHALARGPMLASELARRSNVTNPTMTRIVDALVEKGFVERHPDPVDRRRIHLQLTKTGAQVGSYVHDCFRVALVRFLSPLSDTQIADIRRAFGHLSTLLPDTEEWCPPTQEQRAEGT
jgi:DNA-binding MarR family transcriptional regulator